MADPSVPNQDGTCHFFLLSAELRNAIYEFSLSEPNGLFYRYEKGDPATKTCKMFNSLEAVSNDSAMEANQLKYVCRQLYNEVSGLGVKVNDLNFTRVKFSQPLPWVQLLDFISHCSPRTKNQIRQIHCRTRPGVKNTLRIRESYQTREQYRRSVQLILDFCTTHPKASLATYLSLPLDPINYAYHLFKYGIIYQIAFRGRDFRTPRSSRCLKLLEKRDSGFRCGIPFEQFRIPNFQFWPPTADFDEDAFRSEGRTAGGVIAEFVETWPGGMDAVVEEVHQWHVKGILSEP